jgi:hypothetical protein
MHRCACSQCSTTCSYWQSARIDESCRTICKTHSAFISSRISYKHYTIDLSCLHVYLYHCSKMDVTQTASGDEDDMYCYEELDDDARDPDYHYNSKSEKSDDEDEIEERHSKLNTCVST